jgi:hypothetical protein
MTRKRIGKVNGIPAVEMSLADLLEGDRCTTCDVGTIHAEPTEDPMECKTICGHCHTVWLVRLVASTVLSGDET